VNRFTTPEKRSIQTLRVDDEIRDRQTAKLAELRRRRDSVAVSAALESLRGAAEGGANVMPTIVSCVESSATLEEICNVLRQVYGEQTQSFV
jgi:methylmalonyl-CoA mutase, N-terminal domain